MTYIPKTIKSVVDEMNVKYFLPDIQRKWVWKEKQIYTLFDSLMRRYPISTFLFWKIVHQQNNAAMGRVKFIDSYPSTKTPKDFDPEKNEYFLVLDGQQRLQSFFIALRGSYAEKELFLNVYSNGALDYGADQETDDIIYETKFHKNRSDFFKDKGRSDTLWVKIKTIIACKDIYDFIEKVKQEEQITDNRKIKQLNENIKLLRELINERELIYYYTEETNDVDRVLDIFVRTNSGGTKLSHSDLFFSIIKRHWSEARDSFEKLLKEINGDRQYRFTEDFILKTALVIYAKNSEGIRYQVKNIDRDLVEKIKKDWKKIDKSIRNTVDLLYRLNLRDGKLVPSYNALIPIVHWDFKNALKGFGTGQKFTRQYQADNAGRWLIKAFLVGQFGGHSDTMLDKCRAVIEDSGDEFPIMRLGKIEFKELREDYLEGIRYQSIDSHLVLTLCYLQNDRKIELARPKAKGNFLEQDHIFSKKELKKAGVSRGKDDIGNIRYLESGANKSKSGKSFDGWRQSMSKKDWEEEMEKHFIPKGEWNISNFNEFLDARKKLLYNALRKSF